MDINISELADQVDTAKWQWLKPHYERGVIFLIDIMLELPDVGEKLATDNAAAVQAWLASGLVKKPEPEQINKWDSSPDKAFSILVIAPFVLIQELTEDAQQQNKTIFPQ